MLVVPGVLMPLCNVLRALIVTTAAFYVGSLVLHLM